MSAPRSPLVTRVALNLWAVAMHVAAVVAQLCIGRMGVAKNVIVTVIAVVLLLSTAWLTTRVVLSSLIALRDWFYPPTVCVLPGLLCVRRSSLLGPLVQKAAPRIADLWSSFLRIRWSTVGLRVFTTVSHTLGWALSFSFFALSWLGGVSLFQYVWCLVYQFAFVSAWSGLDSFGGLGGVAVIALLHALAFGIVTLIGIYVAKATN